MGPGADLQGGLGGLQPPLQLLQPWISEVGDEEEEVEERRKWREGEEEEEISPPLIHFLDPPLGAGKVELYGYVAARDELEPFLNYVVNISRDDPFTVEQVHIHTYLQFFQGISLANRPKY